MNQGQTDLISVIIPVYKVEKYLDKCVQSVVDQTYRNLEIILVDDGSPDRCGEMCDAWAQKDSRIRVIHKTNGGLSDARNAGLDIATGAYIGFVDSDDYIHYEMYQRLYQEMIDRDADIVICDFSRVNESDGSILSSYDDLYKGLVNKTEAMRCLCHSGKYMAVWNKLFRRHLFAQLRFPYGKIGEDVYIMPMVYDKCKTIVATPSKYYYYVQTPNSICRGNKSIKHLDGVEAYYSMLQFCKEKGYDELLPEIAAKIVDLYLTNMKCIEEISPEEKKRLREIKRMVRYSYIKYGSNIRFVNMLNVELPAIYRFLLHAKRNLISTFRNRSLVW